MENSVKVLLLGLRLIAAAVCAFVLGTTTARADVTVTAFSDLEGAPSCTISGGTAGSCNNVADAASSANLATGVLAAQANCCQYTNSTYVSSGQAQARGQFTDTITLVLPFVTLNMTVNGATFGISGPTNGPQYPSAWINDTLSLLDAGFSFQQSLGCVSTDPADFCSGQGPSLNVSVTLTNVPTSDLMLTFAASLEASARGFDPGIGVFPKGSGFADALDPGQLSIDLPSGFSFTSGSGVLLTQAATVPEPSSLVLLGSCIGAAALVRRRRRSR
jgi:hypothetical protein